VRPTTDLVRGALFSILAPLLPDFHVLDLFAGTGALGIEALSRGAATADFVESNPRQCADIRASIDTCGYADRCRVHRTRAERFIESPSGPYDLLLLDPPYAYAALEDLLRRIAASSLVTEGTVVVAEHSKRQPLPADCGSLVRVKERNYGETCITVYRIGGQPW
jgi:16S rRNA (guanine(966)-N(2))-methyltransferase RsmD